MNMAKKKSKKSSAQSINEELPNVGGCEADRRLLCSPYTSTYIKVFFGANAKAMKVPATLLEKCSNLPAGNIVVADSLHLTHIPEEVGHVLVHHLFTETFQCLAPEGSTHREQRVTELMTCIRVYAAAWDYELNSLKDQARSEIERLGACLPVVTLLAAWNEVYPNPSKDDIWLGDHLKDRMKALFSGQEVEKDTESSQTAAKSSITELVFHNALCLHEEELKRNRGLIDYGAVCHEDMPGPDSEVQLAYNESLHEPAHKHEFAGQKNSSKPTSASDLEENESTLESEPIDVNGIAGSPQHETVRKLSYADNAQCKRKPCRGPAGGSDRDKPTTNDADLAEVLITYEEVSVEFSTLEPPLQDKTEFAPGSETDTSSPVFTPPSSTTSYISIDPKKVQRLGIEETQKQEAQRVIKKTPRTNAKDSKRRKLREAQALQKPEGLHVVCEFMSQHLKIGGEWSDCELCRKLVDGLAAEL